MHETNLPPVRRRCRAYVFAFALWQATHVFHTLALRLHTCLQPSQ